MSFFINSADPRGLHADLRGIKFGQILENQYDYNTTLFTFNQESVNNWIDLIPNVQRREAR